MAEADMPSTTILSCDISELLKERMPDLPVETRLEQLGLLVLIYGMQVTGELVTITSLCTYAQAPRSLIIGLITLLVEANVLITEERATTGQVYRIAPDALRRGRSKDK